VISVFARGVFLKLFIFAVLGMSWRAIESAEQDQALE
jgi:hypothetical protein